MKTSTFQLVVSALFVFFLIAGVGIFAAFGGLGGGASAGTVSIWGTMEQNIVETWLQTLRPQDAAYQDVSYRQIPAASYDSTLVNAMASGQGPDLFMLADDRIVDFADKIAPIPYGSYSQGSFVSAFVDEGQLYLAGDGIRALPLTLDPLVMYWNRDILASAGVASPPLYWSELLTIAPKISSLDQSQTVRRSAAALGTWRNVQNAKLIMATLLLQAGDTIVARGQDGSLQATLGTAAGGGESPAASALRFYTEFANPAKSNYSWNNSMLLSTNAFLAGDVGLYFGLASEYANLRARNPNLRFDVAVVPQLRSGAQTTYGRMMGLAVSRGARNPAGASTIAQKLSSRTAVAALAGLSPLPPVRRDVALDTSTNAAASTMARSALISRGWLDPGDTDVLFKDMIESVLSGKSEPAQAVFEAAAALREMVAGRF